MGSDIGRCFYLTTLCYAAGLTAMRFAARWLVKSNVQLVCMLTGLTADSGTAFWTVLLINEEYN
jgi:hypothetical protein